MANNTIEAIREAELSSQNSEKEAKQNAARMVEEAHVAAKSILTEKTQALKAGEEAEQNKAAEESRTLLERAKQEATAEIEAMRSAAAGKENAAIDAVLAKLIG